MTMPGGVAGTCAALVLYCCYAGACCAEPRSPSRNIEKASRMTEGKSRFVGAWRKIENPACATLYPAVLQLDGNGLSRGFPEPPGQFTTWDVGTWEPVDSGHLAISTANDAVVRYEFSLTEDTLSFADSDGCRFSYRREP